MKTYTIISLDVWGHSPSECAEWGCPCVSKCGEHDENLCDCYYQVNQEFNAGKIELSNDTDVHLLGTLIDAGYLECDETLEDIEFDWNDETSCTIYEKKTGCPMYGLRLDDECSQCGAMPHSGTCD